ncbi:dihydrofolate reductase [Trifolium repens]|nr:dihydrofolate reductase [Trifolium repens]
MMENQMRPRILCLHGFRTNGQILKKSIFSRWPQTVIQKLDLVFLDAQCLAHGKSEVEGIFDPPYYEWFQSNEDYTEYRNFEECIVYIEDYMLKNGPFDGVLGFSQGAVVAAALPGMQAQGVAFQKISKIKFMILISGALFRGLKYGKPKLATHAFSKPIDCPSLHIIGEKDYLKPESMILLEAFVNPVLIHHPKGHEIPRLDEKSLGTLLSFIDTIQGTPSYGHDLCRL